MHTNFIHDVSLAAFCLFIRRLLSDNHAKEAICQTNPLQYEFTKSGRALSSGHPMTGVGMNSPRTSAPPSPTGAGAILTLVRHGEATTRAALKDVTGLSRSTIGQRVDALLAGGYLTAGSVGNSTGGRPATELAINPRYGHLLLAAVGASGFRVAISDFSGELLDIRSQELDITEGPEKVLGEITALFHAMTRDAQQDLGPLRGIGVGLPGPVAFAQQEVIRPPIMAGWDGFSANIFFARHFDVPVLIDNDVNLMALGEWKRSFPDISELLYLKLGTGIGAGLIMGGTLQRGVSGGAGDLGHWFMPQLGEAEPRLCRCGNRGCFEAYCSGWALCEELGLPNVQSLARLAAAGDARVLARLRHIGEQQGEILALAINLVNPAVIVVGGALAQSNLMASLREVVYRRSGVLAAQELQIVFGPLKENAGLYGASYLLIDTLLDPRNVDRDLTPQI